MRPLHLFVVLETVLLAVVAVFWGLRSGEGGPVAVGTEQARSSDAGSVPRRAESAAKGSGERMTGSEVGGRVAVSGGAGADVAVLVRGRVRVDDGSEAPDGVRVLFRRVGDVRHATCVGARYALSNLRPGVWTVECNADGFVPGSREVELSAEAAQAVDLELTRAWRLSVVVEGVDGVDLRAAMREFGVHAAFHAVATDEPVVRDSVELGSSGQGLAGIGRFEVHRDSASRPSVHGEAGVFWLEHPPPVHVALLLHHMVIARQTVATGAREVRFVVDPSWLSERLARVVLRVVDGATGRAVTEGIRGSILVAGGKGAAIAAPDGDRLVFARVFPGHASLRIMAGAEREPSERDVQVPVGGTLDLGDLVVHPVRVLHGRLFDAAGKPSAGEIYWGEVSAEGRARGIVANRITPADGDGRFAIHQLGPHRYVVVSKGSNGGFGHAVVDASLATEEQPVEIRLGPSARITIHPGPPDEEAWRVTARDEGGIVVLEEWLRGGSRGGSLSLGAGRWRIEVETHEGVELLRKDVDLAAEAHEILEVRR